MWVEDMVTVVSCCDLFFFVCLFFYLNDNYMKSLVLGNIEKCSAEKCLNIHLKSMKKLVLKIGHHKLRLEKILSLFPFVYSW